MYTMVLLRHGESVWNRENRFTGWTDVDLTDVGVQEAHQAARLLLAHGFVFDVAFTSLLKRAIRTLWIVLDEMDLMWIPVHRSWRLNERHYGALQGLNRSDTAERYGEEQVFSWRRSYDERPPALDPKDPRHPRRDLRYGRLLDAELPATECLKDVIARFLPEWNHVITPAIRSGQRAIIVAHGNSLRAIVKYLDRVADEDIVDVNIPTGVPLVYHLDEKLLPVERRYLDDQERIATSVGAVRARGSSRRKTSQPHD